MSTGTSCHICCKFQKYLFEIWFYKKKKNIMVLYHVYSHRSGVDNPRGHNFCQQKPHYFGHLLQVLKKISLKSDFKHFFYDFIYTCIKPWGRAWQPHGNEILMSSGTSCHFGHLLLVSKKSLWSLILYDFFHDFIHVYSPRAGTDSPQGTKFWCQQKCLVTPFIASLKKVFEVWFYTIFYMI